jgi:large subunit ribosomal protein L18Ae
MRIFAQDDVVAKSKFWYYLRRLNKIKRAHGEILSVNEVNLNINKIAFPKRPH